MTAIAQLEIRRVKTGNRVQYFKGEEKLNLPSVTQILAAVINKPVLTDWIRDEALRTASALFKELLLEVDIKGPQVLTDARIDAILEMAKQRPDKIKTDAANLGTRIHECIDSLLMGGKPVIDDDIRPAATAAKMWIAREKPDVVKREFSMVSKKLQIVGTLDYLGRLKNGLVVGDYKTTDPKPKLKPGDDPAKVYPEQAYQLAMYAYLYEEVTGERVEEGFIFWINRKNPEFLVRKVEGFRDYVKNVPAMVSFYKGLKSVKFLPGEEYTSSI